MSALKLPLYAKIQRAAEMNMMGENWKSIAAALGKSEETVRKWKRRLPHLWYGFSMEGMAEARNKFVSDALMAARMAMRDEKIVGRDRVALLGHAIKFIENADKRDIERVRYKASPCDHVDGCLKFGMSELDRCINRSRAKKQAAKEAKEQADNASKIDDAYKTEEKQADSSKSVVNTAMMGLVLLVGLFLGGLGNQGASVAREQANTMKVEAPSEQALVVALAELSQHDITQENLDPSHFEQVITPNQNQGNASIFTGTSGLKLNPGKERAIPGASRFKAVGSSG